MLKVKTKEQVGASLSNVWLADDFVVCRMRSDPEPLNSAWHIVSEGTISLADANRPRFPDSFEVKRWMPRIGLEKLEVFIGGLSNLWRQRVIQRPEARGCPVFQRGRLLPALCSAKDSSMR